MLVTPPGQKLQKRSLGLSSSLYPHGPHTGPGVLGLHEPLESSWLQIWVPTEHQAPSLVFFISSTCCLRRRIVMIQDIFGGRHQAAIIALNVSSIFFSFLEGVSEVTETVTVRLVK